MISIIVCSIRPEQAKALEQNIAATIGVPHEFVAYDNRGTGKGICEVYNECAERAKYDLLCFVHEDVVFHTNGWGEILADRLTMPGCGVVGFAGGTAKLPYPYGWQSIRNFTRKNYIRGAQKGKKASLRSSGSGAEYDKVVTLDGMALCVCKDVWSKVRFDNVLFTGFHSYDTDFTTAVYDAGYCNYVCNTIVFEHLSQGSFSKEWYGSVQLYLKKWGGKLPMYVKGNYSERQIEKAAPKVEAFAILQLIKNRIVSREEAQAMVNNYRKTRGFGLNVVKMLLKLKKYS